MATCVGPPAAHTQHQQRIQQGHSQIMLMPVTTNNDSMQMVVGFIDGDFEVADVDDDYDEVV